MLDFVPNAVHAGLYAAQAEGDYRRRGLAVELVAPTGTAQPLTAVSSGRATIGLADLIDVTLANRQGADLRVVAAVVQRPLISLMARADGPIHRPRDLEGRTVGLTGVPSDRAIARTIIAGDGGDPDRVHFVVIGFSAVPSLVGRKVDAAIGFWPADGVELQRRVPDRIFRLERFGGPAFPELVIFARADTLRRDPGARAAVPDRDRPGLRARAARPLAGARRSRAAARTASIRPWHGPACGPTARSWPIAEGASARSTAPRLPRSCATRAAPGSSPARRACAVCCAATS